MIKNITIKNTATYDEIGSELTNLKKINIIYGANGSGKTTLSNFIADATDSRYTSCSIDWRYDSLNTLVYNKVFRDKNFGNGNINGVFTLGHATTEILLEVEKKKKELANIKLMSIQKKDTLEKQEISLNELEDGFREKSWKEVYKKYENNFKEAFRSYKIKIKFKDKLLSEFSLNNSNLLRFEELEIKFKTIFGDTPQNISTIKNIVFNNIDLIESNELWRNKIIGKSDVDIARLIQYLDINDWVNQGKVHIQDNSNICPFCQQETITENFKEQLEKYFNMSFVESVKDIKHLNSEYVFTTQNLINELIQLETNHKNNLNTKLDVDKFSGYLKTLVSQFTSNKELLSNKIKEPSRSIELISTIEQLKNIFKLIDKANEEINKHNNIVQNYQIERQNLIVSIWKYIVEEYKSEIEIYQKTVDGLKKGINNLKKEHQSKQHEWKVLNHEIVELGKNITSVQPTVDEINRTLEYYGFLNFKIVPSSIDINQYQIQREDGSLAESTLSEGEITFITFLYFLQLTKGAIDKEKISQERILVIDDPISSLDSNVLFIVSTLIKKIKEEIKEDKGHIKQLIILTHNVYFHKEVSFIDGRSNGDKNTDYWILRKKNKISTFASYGIKNPIKTSYELLWQELKDKEENSTITIQNTIRRILENYFKILGNYNKFNLLIDKFEIQEEQVICKSLMSWINDGSHSITDDLFIELQDDSIDKYLEVFRKIFKLTNHEGHYNMMMSIEN